MHIKTLKQITQRGQEKENRKLPSTGQLKTTCNISTQMPSSGQLMDKQYLKDNGNNKTVENQMKAAGEC